MHEADVHRVRVHRESKIESKKLRKKPKADICARE